MDERQKTKVVMLGISGVMMCAAGYAYTWYHEQKAAQAEEEQSVPVVSVRRKSPIARVAMTAPVGGTTATSGMTNTPPGASKSAVDALPPPPITGKSGDPGATPPVVAQLPPVITPPVVKPVQVPVAVKPAQVAPTAKPVPVHAGNVPPTTKPNVAQTVAPTAKPVVAQTAVPAAKPIAPTAKPIAQTTAPPSKPVAPTATPAVAQTAVPTAKGVPAPSAKPAAIAAVRPQPLTATAKPVAPTATPPAIPPVANGQPLADATATPPAAPTLTAAGKELYLATTMGAAAQEAAAKKGSPEPTKPVTVFPSWPPVRGGSMLANKDAAALMALVPPPPPPGPPKPKKINEKLVPPPPPEAMGTGGIAGLPIDQLPVPPSRPTIGDKVKIIGVFDDRAILAFPKTLAIKNKWPKTITLGTGDQFESLTIVSINRDGVTIEEDGERTMKPIGTVK